MKTAISVPDEIFESATQKLIGAAQSPSVGGGNRECDEDVVGAHGVRECPQHPSTLGRRRAS